MIEKVYFFLACLTAYLFLQFANGKKIQKLENKIATSLDKQRKHGQSCLYSLEKLIQTFFPIHLLFNYLGAVLPPLAFANTGETFLVTVTSLCSFQKTNIIPHNFLPQDISWVPAVALTSSLLMLPVSAVSPWCNWQMLMP